MVASQARSTVLCQLLVPAPHGALSGLMGLAGVLLLLLPQCLANIEEGELDLSCPAWQAASADARKLVSAMLAKDPQLRPTAQQLLDTYSSWLQRGLSLQQ